MNDFASIAGRIIDCNMTPDIFVTTYCTDRDLDYRNITAAFADWRNAYLAAITSDSGNQIDRLCPMGDEDVFAEVFDGFAERHGLNEDERYVFCYMVYSFEELLTIGGDAE